ncbi:hypothetical protein GOZ83_12695 [Agrobacterium vitis]|nr:MULTISPECIES: hypothetical protein [Rhizobium/Agrobacterium group]MVA45926.1 hypothetical protein [Agrobacterium vitis]
MRPLRASISGAKRPIGQAIVTGNGEDGDRRLRANGIERGRPERPVA